MRFAGSVFNAYKVIQMPGICGTAESPVVPQENLVDQYQFHVTCCAFFDPSQLVIKKPCPCFSYLHAVLLGFNSAVAIWAQIARKGKHNSIWANNSD